MKSNIGALKPFQEATVEHVFRCLYGDEHTSTHFLVADEVGLGKTLVAQGVIRKATAHLKSIGTRRIDIVYLCSNQAIAKQNLLKLRKALPAGASLEPSSADRMTLMALAMDEVGESGKVNFFPLTPDTSFNMGNAMGKQEERRFLYHFLAQCFHGKYAFMREQAQGLPGKALMRMLKGQVRCPDSIWYNAIAEDWRAIEAVGRLGDPKQIIGELHEEILSVAREYPTHHRAIPHSDLNGRVRSLVKELRLRIAIASVKLLEPDLIIMDEFQRFTSLLHEGSDKVVSQLVRQLTSYRDEHTGQPVRMLLLSATPYRHLTLETDSEEGDRSHRQATDTHEDGEPVDEIGVGDGHREDFAGTLRILFRDRPEIVEEVMAELACLRRYLISLPGSFDDGVALRDSIQRKLLAGMARTERVDTLRERNSMIEEVPVSVDLEGDDLIDVDILQKLAKTTQSRDPTEFWKSAPYLLNFMHGYSLLSQIERARDARNGRTALVRSLLNSASSRAIKASDLKSYKELPARNGRLRAIFRYAFDGKDRSEEVTGKSALAGRVWLPPALPYHRQNLPRGENADETGSTFPNPEKVSKALVFSSWQVVPDTIAALTSYEAERRSSLANGEYHNYNKAPGIEDAATNILRYASPTIAQMIDPLSMCYGPNRLQDLDSQRRHIIETLRAAFKPKRRSRKNTQGPAHQIWNAILDADGWKKNDVERPDLLSARNRRVTLSDGHAFRLIADFCLGSPATCALRALMRVTHLPPDSLTGSGKAIGAEIVKLMSRPLNAAHILSERGSGKTTTWITALRYSVKHDLQSVLDEWFHLLANDAATEEGVDPERLTIAVKQALSVIPSSIAVRDVADWSRLRTEGKDDNASKSFTMRGYFAMRLANAQGEKDDEGNRVGKVKDAFCSPFAPFILTTTSVGQEGLDFHPYCHRVYHWNVPTNPVDLEQREGRVHRYKGHALRLNLAEAQAHVLCEAIVRGEMLEPWQTMFDAAEMRFGEKEKIATRGDGRSPSWVLSGKNLVKRLALIYPFSREVAAYQKVRNDLTLYRLAFGQVRQDDLLNHLTRLKASGEINLEQSDSLQISLRPEALVKGK